MKKSNTSKFIFIGLGGVMMFLFSFTIIYDLLIPDPCYYHTNEMNSFMCLFYSAGPVDNGHPVPNFTNFMVSFIIGGLLGIALYKLTTVNTHPFSHSTSHPHTKE
ncbi:hypothetical protein H9X57_03540 [Flavobacterium piscinae]|uniref:Uncharacterized protein n=1 Tax=Flavobacterium piscinae TaxID=2506424 RepID=A0A4Q1KF70_9FLAO|nr:hypothetical protein [Flavobacterium piscinae]MBC8882791.1 hypothetical protein [Flavobacterium piscinae]RXR28318.1 hypothetical protein EQG68_14440 [Flavobacterium piscinae]